jgi:hypothetical protein
MTSRKMSKTTTRAKGAKQEHQAKNNIIAMSNKKSNKTTMSSKKSTKSLSKD